MYFDLPAIHDALQNYIGPKHNLHAVCKSLMELYDSSFFRIQTRYNGYSGFVRLPAHKTNLRNKVTSIMKQENFAIDISCLRCLERAVYSDEDMRSQTNATFEILKRSMLACVCEIYLDCHWAGYLVATPTAKSRDWILSPVYRNEQQKSTPFDFNAYERELNIYLTDWPNLKKIYLFQPYKNNLFLKCLYARTRSIVDKIKKGRPNPHHLTIVEIGSDGLSEIECIENSLLFMRNVDSRVICKGGLRETHTSEHVEDLMRSLSPT